MCRSVLGETLGVVRFLHVIVPPATEKSTPKGPRPKGFGDRDSAIKSLSANEPKHFGRVPLEPKC
jgi:hypothetical protein